MKTSKKILQVSLILSLLMAMTLMFAGCGGPETLEEYVNSDSEAQEMIDSLSSSGLSVDVTDNTLTCTYAYSDTFDDETISAMQDAIESQITKLSSTFESAATTLEEGSGIDDVTVKVVYVDGAGTEIYSAEF